MMYGVKFGLGYIAGTYSRELIDTIALNIQARKIVNKIFKSDDEVEEFKKTFKDISDDNTYILMQRVYKILMKKISNKKSKKH